jgi:hypothetical protein
MCLVSFYRPKEACTEAEKTAVARKIATKNTINSTLHNYYHRCLNWSCHHLRPKLQYQYFWNATTFSSHALGSLCAILVCGLIQKLFHVTFLQPALACTEALDANLPLSCRRCNFHSIQTFWPWHNSLFALLLLKSSVFMNNKSLQSCLYISSNFICI